MDKTMTGQALSTAYFEAQAAALAAGRPAGEPAWLAERRAQALERFRALGLPQARQEDWKYTNLLRALRDQGFAPAGTRAQPASLDHVPSLLPGTDAPHRLVFVDGAYRPELSSAAALPAGASLANLAGLLERAPERLADWLGAIAQADDQPFFALNTALATDGPVLLLDDGIAVDAPIELVYVGGLAEPPPALHPRLLVVLGENSRASIVEHFVGLGSEGGSFTNAAAEIAVGAGAHLRHLRVQADGASAYNIATTHVAVARDAHYEAFAFTTGARLSRHEVRIRLEGEGAEARLDGAYLLRGRQHADTTTVIDHLVPHTTSRETYKGAVDDAARAVFQGRIAVAPQAQKADGRMLSKALLLSEQAEIDAKPELEIFADDVLCAHGATAGEIDSDALFYLRTRGLPAARARSLLVEAFVAEALDLVPDARLQPALRQRLRAWLDAA